ncbi:helix-turn-helix transcriptional regulator [Roseospira visakhapatnamensis]|uniref:Putative DNA-binding transcriptional regulator AlpA n=1 Tax=Roseospira visakhapatnamensis TaxID=390880 RepID=A0A7W6WBM4_9PROT|nr:hypothetical protein [Roseospira visakhapatnamensis]MBB4267692.1 putative DNA-binding transcriptional regulator AlpA [Roseospira visakhapatnamensis]
MTARRLAPHELPDWPRSMGLELAAAYVGLSPSKFWGEVNKQGSTAPQPIALTAGRRVWLKEDLDAWLDRAAGRVHDEATGNAWLNSLKAGAA